MSNNLTFDYDLNNIHRKYMSQKLIKVRTDFKAQRTLTNILTNHSSKMSSIVILIFGVEFTSLKYMSTSY